MQIKRDAAIDQLKNHTESMKLLERDIYEINRKPDIVNTQNCRFKLVSILKLDRMPFQHEVLCSSFISENQLWKMMEHKQDRVNLAF